MTKDLTKVELVMGWDIGDGDTVVYAKIFGNLEKNMFPLFIHKKRSEQIVASAVAKTSGNMILIGEDASNQRNFQINFKRSPGKWDNQSEQKVAYRQHMFDFICGVSNTVLSNITNAEILKPFISTDGNGAPCWNDEKVLVVVGCPASKNWKKKENREQYEELISEATGMSNVIVVEESRAALFSLFALDHLREKINLQQGALVLDFGSSTADATCIIPGEKAVHLSWELGAAQIEKAMLHYILSNEKTQNLLMKQAKAYERKRALIDTEDCNHVIFQLRGDKEAYFDQKVDGNTIGKNVRLCMIDENGDLIKDDDGESVDLSVNYKITPEMINYAVESYEFDAKKDDSVVSTGTWKQNCQNFLSAAQLLLETNKISAHTIVVTGGGSNMPFVIELAKSVFGSEKVVPSDAPSLSVVRGLTTIAYNALIEDDIREKTIEGVLAKGRTHVNETINNIAYNLAEKAYDDAVAALDAFVSGSYTADPGAGRFFEGLFNWNQTVGDITKIIKNALDASLKKNANGIIEAELKKWDKADQKMIVDAVNQAVRKMYSDRTFQNMIRINYADVSTIKGNLNLPDVNIPNIGADTNIIGKIIGIVLTMVLAVVLAIIAAVIPGFGFTFVALTTLIGGSAIIEWMKKKEGFHVPLASVKSAVRNMKSDKTSELGTIKQPIYDEIEKALTNEKVYGKNFHKHYTVLEETTNRAFDRILLIAEDDE